MKTIKQMFAQFKDGEFVPGTIKESPLELADNGVPISQMGRVIVTFEDGVAGDWFRACGVCWSPIDADRLECTRHERTFGPPMQSNNPISLHIRDLWEQGLLK